MSGVRGDARKRQSQPAPEVRMTEAERMAYLAGYEFALSHIHDEPVQADLALLSSDTTEAPGVRAVIEREVAKERERIAQAIEARMREEEQKECSGHSSGVFSGLYYAARIAREAGQP